MIIITTYLLILHKLKRKLDSSQLQIEEHETSQVGSFSKEQHLCLLQYIFSSKKNHTRIIHTYRYIAIRTSNAVHRLFVTCRFTNLQPKLLFLRRTKCMVGIIVSLTISWQHRDFLELQSVIFVKNTIAHSDMSNSS